MDFELSDDQVALVDGIRSLLAGRFGIEAVRACEATGGIDRAGWRELAETGVFSLVLPEADGGVGLGFADAVLVFEELGRRLVPGPLVGTFVAAGLVDGAASGDAVVGVVERPAPGVAAFVEHLGVLDALLVLDDEGVWRVDPTGVLAGAEALHRPLDPLTPAWIVPELPKGDRVGDAALCSSLRTQGAALIAALQLGVAEGACELATAYAKERQQFGKPIGAFQAVKHLCADMISRVEVARAAVYQAGVCLDDPSILPASYAASVARVVATPAADANGKDCVQVHGGMGYTWEVDAHLFVKRAWVLATQFGSADDHAESLALTFA